MADKALAKVLTEVGVGLRGPHVPDILSSKPDIPWFELLTDNHLSTSGVFSFQAQAISELYPVALHGTGLSIGSISPIDWDYVSAVRELARRTQAVHISEHLSFSAGHEVNSHELLPLPRTEETLKHVAARIGQVQDFLGERILIENVSTYLEYSHDEFSDAEFVSQLCVLADCNLLLDVNNVYVNTVNHGYDLNHALDDVVWQYVKEIHVAGHENKGDLLLDTHGGPVVNEVVELMKIAVQNAPLAPVLLEWDTNLPIWSTLLEEAQRLQLIKAEMATEVVV